MEYTKGEKVLFANGIDLKEGVVVRIYIEDKKPMLLINSIGSTFIRRPDGVIHCTINQAKASSDIYRVLKEIYEDYGFAFIKEILDKVDGKI